MPRRNSQRNGLDVAVSKPWASAPMMVNMVPAVSRRAAGSEAGRQRCDWCRVLCMQPVCERLNSVCYIELSSMHLARRLHRRWLSRREACCTAAGETPRADRGMRTAATTQNLHNARDVQVQPMACVHSSRVFTYKNCDWSIIIEILGET